MNGTKIEFSIAKAPHVPDEYYKHRIEKLERDLAYELFKKIDNGYYNSVKIYRYTHKTDVEIAVTGAIAERVRIEMPVIEIPRRLGFIDRLRVLFTGNVPFTI